MSLLETLYQTPVTVTIEGFMSKYFTQIENSYEANSYDLDVPFKDLHHQSNSINFTSIQKECPNCGAHNENDQLDYCFKCGVVR